MTSSARMIIFDDGLGELGPMVDLRASFEVRSGMLTTAGRIAALRSETLAGYWVPERLAAVVAERAKAPVNEIPASDAVFCVNGRWGLPDDKLRLEPGAAAVEEGTGHVIAAHLGRKEAERFLETNELPAGTETRALEAGALYRYPWEVLRHRFTTIPLDISATKVVDAKPADQARVVGEHPVSVHRSAVIYPHVVLDAGAGPIIIQERAVIRPGAVLCGPCSVGRDATIVDHALIKPNTVVGPVCKVGGEVGGTIFQGYSNKAHDGHLGDSWVGKWVNFGAGTTSSNLQNTYGEVNMQLDPDDRRHATGLVFAGTIVGDHVKFAISTRIMTGTVVGTGAMIATTAPPAVAVRRFAWLTDRGESVFRLDKFLETARKMMARRDKQPSEAYVAVIRALHPDKPG